LVFYEAPHRILESLEDVITMLGPRPVVVARELTKVHEEFLRGTAEEVLAVLRGRESIKGEITLLIARGRVPAVAATTVRERVEQLMSEQHLDRMDALKLAARERGISKREAYKQWEENGSCHSKARESGF
jgi:16S rRNA (cytidine1402-2'-O)-methyltransferase